MLLYVYVGKCMAALLTGLSDRNSTVRMHYSNSLASICKLAKDSSVEKLVQRLHSWYMDKEGKYILYVYDYMIV